MSINIVSSSTRVACRIQFGLFWQQFMVRKQHRWSSERLILYSYFIGLILSGTVALSLPLSWGGSDGLPRVALIDAFFTAVSAVCVTGLITIDTALWSRAGQGIILLLIQAGGLGIVTFGMLYLVLPRVRISLKSTKLLRESFVVEQMPQARHMIGSILSTTLIVEGLGAAFLIFAFRRAETEAPVFEGIFHAVSAFCNAGFSLFSSGLVPFRGNVLVNIVLMILIIVGGIGFMVIRDLSRKFREPRKPLMFHTRIMLIAVPLFIIFGWIGYLALDDTEVFTNLPAGERYMAALFQSITTRTAGFNTVDQSSLSATSRWMTLVLMLVGGGSGSTAGGIKVSTAFILFIVLFRGVNERGDIRLLRRRIPSEDVSRAAMFFLKAVALLFISILLLGILERPGYTEFTTSQIIFECVSALGTVGLSMGITGALSIGGKIVIALTMFAGRVGLFSLVIRYAGDRAETLIEYPKGEVLIG
ncbi:MAG: potassium transporter TrkG [Spirochaetaceae bacterium]|nr:potassium transporter TrkG [Spirochaetaceae bacterium]